MRKLIVMRHAKSAWDNPEWGDHERPLRPRGHRAARAVAASLLADGARPMHALVSDARRTFETWRSMMEVFNTPISVTFTPRLYLAEPEGIAAVTRTAPDDATTLLVLGHNPGIEQWASHLAGETLSFRTAAWALFDVATDDWNVPLHRFNVRLHAFGRGRESSGGESSGGESSGEAVSPGHDAGPDTGKTDAGGHGGGDAG